MIQQPRNNAVMTWTPLFAGVYTGKFNKVQKFVDSEVLRLTTPYVPLKSGELIRSGIRETIIGSGVVKYKTPYSQKLYHAIGFNFRGAPQRGAKWFEKMKEKHNNYIVTKAAELMRSLN